MERIGGYAYASQAERGSVNTKVRIDVGRLEKPWGVVEAT